MAHSVTDCFKVVRTESDEMIRSPDLSQIEDKRSNLICQSKVSDLDLPKVCNEIVSFQRKKKKTTKPYLLNSYVETAQRPFLQIPP